MPDYEVTLDGKRYVLTGDHPPTEAEARAAVGGIAPVASHEPSKTPERTWTDTAVDALPAAGGIAGSLIGGAGGTAFGLGVGGAPGALGGAALGGAAGEAARELINRARGQEAPATPQDAALNIAAQGAGQAGAEIGGRLVGAGLQAGAGRLYQSVLKPTIAARAQYPTLVQTGLEAAIPITKGGAQKAAGLVTRSKEAADALVANRENSVLQRLPGGATLDPQEIYANAVSKAATKGQDLAVGRAAFQKAAGDAGEQFLAENPAPIGLSTAQAQVRTGDRFLNKAYRAAIDRGDTITSGDLAGRLGVNDATRAALAERVPGLAEQNANTQALQGIRKAVERRTGQLGNNSPVGMQHLINAGLGTAVGGLDGKERGAETFLLMEALTNPAIASRLAIGASRAGAPSAQAIRQALIGLMASHAVEQP